MLVTACVVFTVVNSTWYLLPKITVNQFFNRVSETPIEEQMMMGDWLCYLALFTCFSCSFVVNRRYFKENSFKFYLAIDFFLTLSWAKVFTILILNPLEYNWSEFWGFGLAGLVLTYRLIKKKSR